VSLAGNKSRLSALTNELMVRWEETKNHWRDEKSEEFEKRYLVELLAAVERAGNSITELDKLLAKIRKDCE
jgi:hypothetical protein